jgi:hypothetical protein
MSDYKFSYEEIKDLYENDGVSEVSDIVKCREITTKDRDEWLLVLAAEYNHTSLAKALLKLPNTHTSYKDKTVLEHIVNNNNDQLIAAYFERDKRNMEYSLPYFIKPETIEKLVENGFPKGQFEVNHVKVLLENNKDELSIDIMTSVSEVIHQNKHPAAREFHRKTQGDNISALIEYEKSYLMEKYIDQVPEVFLESFDLALGYDAKYETSIILNKLRETNKDDGVLYNKIASSKSLSNGAINYLEDFIKETVTGLNINIEQQDHINIVSVCLNSITPNKELAKFMFNNVPNLIKDFRDQEPEIYSEYSSEQTKRRVMSF